jgi:hypothetical protein
MKSNGTITMFTALTAVTMLFLGWNAWLTNQVVASENTLSSINQSLMDIRETVHEIAAKEGIDGPMTISTQIPN